MESITIPFKNVRQKDKLFLTILNEQIECGKFYYREIDNEEIFKGDMQVLGIPLAVILENLSNRGIEELDENGLKLAISTRRISANEILAIIYDDSGTNFILSEFILKNKNKELDISLVENTTGFAVSRLVVNELLTSTDILSKLGLDERVLTNEEIEQFFPAQQEQAEVKKNSALPKISLVAVLTAVAVAIVKVFFKGEGVEKIKKGWNEVLNNLEENIFIDKAGEE